MSSVSIQCDRSYPLVHPELVDTTILAEDDAPADPCAAELREISASTAKLLVQGLPELPCRCRIQLVSSKLARTLTLAAEIGWARPNLAGDWLVECEFLSRMTEPQFAELLGSGLLERRSAVRCQTRIAVAVQWAPGQPRTSGIVRDLSEGGLCLMTSQAPQATRNVYVIVSTPRGEVPLSLKVRWSLCVGPQHLIGCQFIRGEDYDLLRRLHPSIHDVYLHEHSRAGKPANERT